MSDEREKHIQALAWELVLRGWDSNNALAEADLFVCCCESREADIAEAREREAEATSEPEEDYRLALYINAVRELDSCVELWFITNDYKHGFTPEKTVERWDEYGAYLRRGE